MILTLVLLAGCSFPLDEAKASLEARGAQELAMVVVPGENFDHLFLYSWEGTVKMGGVKDGCLGVPSLSLGPLKGAGSDPPTPTESTDSPAPAVPEVVTPVPEAVPPGVRA